MLGLSLRRILLSFPLQMITGYTKGISTASVRRFGGGIQPYQAFGSWNFSNAKRLTFIFC